MKKNYLFTSESRGPEYSRPFNKIISEASDIQSFNEKTIDYKVEYKKKEFIFRSSNQEYHSKTQTGILYIFEKILRKNGRE